MLLSRLEKARNLQVIWLSWSVGLFWWLFQSWIFWELQISNSIPFRNFWNGSEKEFSYQSQNFVLHFLLEGRLYFIMGTWVLCWIWHTLITDLMKIIFLALSGEGALCISSSWYDIVTHCLWWMQEWSSDNFQSEK